MNFYGKLFLFYIAMQFLYMYNFRTLEIKRYHNSRNTTEFWRHEITCPKQKKKKKEKKNCINKCHVYFA